MRFGSKVKQLLQRDAGGDITDTCELRSFCVEAGMQQMVREATREQYLLDLVLTDVDGLRVQVLPKIADHSVVQAQATLVVPTTEYMGTSLILIATPLKVTTFVVFWWRLHPNLDDVKDISLP